MLIINNAKIKGNLLFPRGFVVMTNSIENEARGAVRNIIYRNPYLAAENNRANRVIGYPVTHHSVSLLYGLPAFLRFPLFSWQIQRMRIGFPKPIILRKRIAGSS